MNYAQRLDFVGHAVLTMVLCVRKWAGSNVQISFNKNKNLGDALHSQEWTKPKLLLDRPGYFLWYPSLQPMNTPEDLSNKNTCLKLGQKARLFIKNIKPEKSEYLSEYIIEFSK